MPAGVNAEKFDSVFVKLLGFPVVAASYFVLLFTHCVVVMRYFGKQSNVPKLQIGIRFGLAFAILYFFGMQEVAVEVSPFREWSLTIGVNWIMFNSFIGLILSGVMSQMLLRSGIDVAIFFLSGIVISKYFVKT